MSKTWGEACIFGFILGPMMWFFNIFVEQDQPVTLFALTISNTNLLWCCIAMFFAPLIIDFLGTTIHRVFLAKYRGE